MSFYLMSGIIFCCYGFVAPTAVEIPECEPPNYPKFGGYGPIQEYYTAGDRIHYFCDVDTYIGGNFLRICEDTGDWSGEAPVCDSAAEFEFSNQTSTAPHPDENDSHRAIDGLKGTCSLTRGLNDSYWTAKLKKPGQLIRVMIFVPRGEVAYEVIMVNRDGNKFSCGKKRGIVDTLAWEFHSCPDSYNHDIVAIEIRSLSDRPLQLCEVVAHTLTAPTCVDPRLIIENGALELTRKTASLVCHKDFTQSADKRLDCIRNGVWNRKRLYCSEKQWDTVVSVDDGREILNDS